MRQVQPHFVLATSWLSIIETASRLALCARPRRDRRCSLRLGRARAIVERDVKASRIARRSLSTVAESQRAHRWRMLDESHGNGRTEARWNL